MFILSAAAISPLFQQVGKHISTEDMNYSMEDIVYMIENDWEIAGEVICKYSDDDFECGINEEIAEARYETNSDCFLL